MPLPRGCATLVPLSDRRTIPNDLEAVSLFVAADVATAAGCTVVANAVMKQLRGIDMIVHVVGGLRLPPAASPY